MIPKPPVLQIRAGLGGLKGRKPFSANPSFLPPSLPECLLGSWFVSGLVLDFRENRNLLFVTLHFF